jgi:tetratricopeptide (TPR) repeat protein
MLQTNKLSLSEVLNCRMAGDLDRARELAGTYCLANENDSAGWYEAGLIERLSNNLPQAVKYQAAALKIKPDFFGAVLDLGICQREMADYPAAINSLLAASRMDATHFAPSYYLGMIYLSLRDLKHAISYFNQALAIDPDSIDALFMAGLCARYDRNYDGADQYFRKVLKLQPDHLMANGLIGQATVLKQLEVITDQILLSKVLDVKRGPFKGLQYIRPTVSDNLYFNLAKTGGIA